MKITLSRPAAAACAATLLARFPVEAQPTAHLVFVHDRVGVAARDPGVVGEPVRALLAAQEGGAGFKSMEPLSEVAAGDDRYAGYQAAVQSR